LKSFSSDSKGRPGLRIPGKKGLVFPAYYFVTSTRDNAWHMNSFPLLSLLDVLKKKKRKEKTFLRIF
jgi:hypothetical protein